MPDLRSINRFPSLVKYLRDELDWPIESDDFEDLVFDFTPEELGIDQRNAAKIEEIKRLRPLSTNQPWGIFFVKFDRKKLPVVALRRLLNAVALKKRASANKADQAAWHANDLLFISNYGEEDDRKICFANFSQDEEKKDLPVLKVLGWDDKDTALHLDDVAKTLENKFTWDEDYTEDPEGWGNQWRSAFSLAHGEVVRTSKDMAIQLAHLAQKIRIRINEILAIENDKGPITSLMAAFKEALIDDLDEDGFADMYAQTIAYGLLSARITNPSGESADDLPSAMPITNPFLKELMEQFLQVGGRKKGKKLGTGIDFDELGVSDVITLLDAANMDAVLKDFGDQNPQEDPVIHFFEGFLQEYDSQIRKDRGVFYTPRPVVSFIVRSVDELLRTEFGLKDGLADTTTWGEMAGRIDDLEIPEGATPGQAFVQILDPATGTGTFLVEVIDLIHKTMTAKWQVEGHGRKKVEKLWNAYVPEHLLPRLHGYELMMAPYAIAHMKIGLKLYETGYRFESDERARVYLTNALEPAQDFSGTLAFAIPALAHEAEAVNAIKRDQRFTVVIGNPPYSSDSQNKGAFAKGLVERYKRDLNERKINLDDDYIKFLALSEMTIRISACGVVGIITNNTYLDGVTLRSMRRELIDAFPRIRIVDLHGSAAKKQRATDGSADKNVFDIEQGVSIALFSRPPQSDRLIIEYCDVRGSRDFKYELLMAQETIPSIMVNPRSTGYYLVPKNLKDSNEWASWPSVDSLMHNKSGFMTQRDEFVISESLTKLDERMEAYFGSSLDDLALKEEFGIHDYRNFSVSQYRRQNRFNRESISRCLFRPFDHRYIYYAPTIVQQASTEIMSHLLRPNIGLLFMRQVVQEKGGYNHFFVTRHPVDHRCMRSNRGYANVAPLFLYEGSGSLLAEDEPSVNFSAEFLDTIRSLAIGGPSLDENDILNYMYGVFYSQSYRKRYAEYLKIEFPRVPVPSSADCFRDVARFGSELVALHLMTSPMSGIEPAHVVGSGPFEVSKVSYSDETVWIDKAKTRGFKGVPEEVWNFHIGGYQVCEKWLKDRQAKGGKNPRPGRVLTDEDIEHYQKIVVALSETIRIMAEIDEVIEAHGGWPGAFQTGDAEYVNEES